MIPSNDAAANSDREVFRESDDNFANSAHVTANGALGINVGGRVIVLPLAEWHRLAATPTSSAQQIEALREALEAIRTLAVDAREEDTDTPFSSLRMIENRADAALSQSQTEGDRS